MPTFFVKSMKPDPEKNFLLNYSDHLNFTFNRVKPPKQSTIQEVLGHIYIFDALRDGYDFLDEVIGLTISPIIGLISALLFTAHLIWGAISLLPLIVNRYYYKIFSVETDETLDCLFRTSMITLLSIAVCIKSAISLITRPLITLINGYNDQNIDRFYVKDSMEAPSS